MVIFGAMGDLTKRKLMPALYELMKEGLVDEEFAGIPDDERKAILGGTLGGLLGYKAPVAG